MYAYFSGFVKTKCDNGYENALEAMQCHLLLGVIALNPKAYHLTLVTKGTRFWNEGGMWCSHPETQVSRSPERSVVYLPAPTWVQLHDFPQWPVKSAHGGDPLPLNTSMGQLTHV